MRLLFIVFSELLDIWCRLGAVGGNYFPDQGQRDLRRVGEGDRAPTVGVHPSLRLSFFVLLSISSSFLS